MAPEGCEGNTFTFDGAQVRIKESNGCQSYLIIETTGSGTRNSIRIGKTRLAASDRAIELFLSETWRLVDAARLCLLKHKIEPTLLTEHHFSLLKNRINR